MIGVYQRDTEANWKSSQWPKLEKFQQQNDVVLNILKLILIQMRMKNQQISCTEKFQIIYMETLPWRRWNITPPSLSVSCTQWLPSKEVKGEGEITWQWRNLINTTSARWSSTTSIVINYVDSMDPWHDVMKTAFYLCGLPPQNP